MSIHNLLNSLDAAAFQTAQKRYEADKKRSARLHKEGHDIVLPPEYYVEIPELLIAAAQGSWVYDYMQVPLIPSLTIGKTPRKVVGAVIDTGGKSRNSLLTNTNYREDFSKSCVAAESGLLDDNNHFSMCASTMFGKDANPFGVCWLPGLEQPYWEWFGVKGLNAQGSGSMAELTAAGYHCLEVKRKHFKDAPMVINASWGGSGSDVAFDKLLEEMEKEGIFFVAAAGNNNAAVNYPGSNKRAFAVSAIDAQGNKAAFSCFGPQIFAAAPGVSVPVGTKDTNGRALTDGTSFASPITAGMLMNLLAYMPEINKPADLRAFAQEGNFDDFGQTGKDNIYGYGVPRAKNLLDSKPSGKPPVEEPETPPTPLPELPTARVLNVPIERKLVTLWKAQNESKFQFLTLTVTVDFNTKYYAEAAIGIINDATEKYFTNRGLVGIAGDDLHRGLYWTRHFYEMLMKTAGYDVKITLLTGVNEKGIKLNLPGDRERNTGKVKGRDRARMIEFDVDAASIYFAQEAELEITERKYAAPMPA